MTLSAGLHFNIPMDDYIADPAPEPSLSRGAVKDLIESTCKHAWYNHPRLNPDYMPSDSARADVGSAVHALILGGKPLAVYDGKDWRKKEAQEFRDQARESGKIPILANHEYALTEAADAAKAALDTLPRWNEGDRDREGTMIWDDDGVWKRGRFDLWSPSANMLIDIKTCGSAEPGGWIRQSMGAGGYDIQAEWYLEGLRACGHGNENTDLLFLLVEISLPYCCSFVGLDPAYSDFAKRKIRMATKLWRKCLADKEWPGYTMMPHWAEPKPWDEGALAEKSLVIGGSE